uniref:Uncharacterized protein n=1 Tax=Amphora coffeiformis TaxID=265554 RepID=A0A7S3P6D4_9STRA|mmetsp:Transcript_3284/g.6276  ORF Transcript_3284/g.6276 Transcript_3284/m.6276 type:complete len:128 (+) Transcript_3284:3-386(+)
MKVQMNARPEDVGTSVGILGNYETGAMLGRQGQVFKDFQDMGFEWQMNPLEDSQLFKDAREPQLPYERCRMPSQTAVARRRLLRAKDSPLYEEATKACAKASSAEFQLCVEGVVATRELALAEEFIH